MKVDGLLYLKNGLLVVGMCIVIESKIIIGLIVRLVNFDGLQKILLCLVVVIAMRV